MSLCDIRQYAIGDISPLKLLNRIRTSIETGNYQALAQAEFDLAIAIEVGEISKLQLGLMLAEIKNHLKDVG